MNIMNLFWIVYGFIVLLIAKEVIHSIREEMKKDEL